MLFFRRNKKVKEREFGSGSNIDLRSLYPTLYYEDNIVMKMNALCECKHCKMQFRKGYVVLTFKDETVDICPYCEENNYRFNYISDMDLENSNLATAPKYSKSEALQIKQLIIDYKVCNVNDEQLELYTNHLKQKLDEMVVMKFK